MKINFKSILAFFLKNIKYVILVLLVLFGISYIAIRERKIVKLTEALTIVEVQNIGLRIEREDLQKELKVLQASYDKIKGSNDSMKLVLKAKQKELKDLQIQHKKEIDSLLNISVPNDTVYVRLQPLFPNFDASPLDYKFSGSQIRQIYSTALSFPRLQSEYAVQGKSLNACITLNDGFEKGINNLNLQIGNLNDNIGKADKQIKNYETQVGLLNKQLKKGKFWGWVFKGTTIIAGTIAMLKWMTP